MTRVLRRGLTSTLALLAATLAVLTQETGGPPKPGGPIAGTTEATTQGIAGGAMPCVPSPTRLCLLDQRFRVEAIWRSTTGHGLGQARPLSDDAGTFWFFSEDNVELVVKVLDGCELDPFNSVWVFAAGLTNVEVRLRVEDTLTGELREYLNPLDTPYAPVQDTEAFDVCF